MTSISASVGFQGANQQADVRVVQQLLNQHAGKLGAKALAMDGKAGDQTVAAIRLFQVKLVGLQQADGRIDPGGKSWRMLAGNDASRLSGAAWWNANQAKFPNSTEVSSLDSAFKTRVDKFLAAMKAGGLQVRVRSTRRNEVRAYLMHYSWKIAKGIVAADKVPAQTGCSIVWDHGSDQASRLGAQQMVGLFNVVFQPSLNSRHIAGKAIDMNIGWAGPAKLRDAAGKEVVLGAPTDETNANLHRVGASYGVIKNVADRPHWSDTGG